MFIREANGVKINEPFFIPDGASFYEAIEKKNIVTTMKFQIENPLDKGRFNDILSNEFIRR